MPTSSFARREPRATESAQELERIRRMYPSLSGETAFLDNAGGSQLPGVVIDAVSAYMRSSYVQLGADYEVSRRATAVVAGAHRFLRTFMGAPEDGHVIMGASTSQLMYTLANAYGEVLKAGDEIIVSEASHESNAGCWVRLARLGVVVKFWRVNPATFRHDLGELDALMSNRTRLVCFPHVSNILGEVMDVASITRRVHASGARVVVDGVALAPHRAMRIRDWGVDWYVYSTYKVFGPHLGALFGTSDALAPLTGPNHFFIPKDELPRKFELGGVSHEGAAGVLALDHFLRDFVQAPRLSDLADPCTKFDRDVVLDAYERMEAMERALHDRLVRYLRGKPGVRLIGADEPGVERVAIVSFVRDGCSSKAIALAGNARGLGFRFGNFYAYRLCQALGLDPGDGVVRVSFCHYNSPAEVDRLIEFFDGVL